MKFFSFLSLTFVSFGSPLIADDFVPMPVSSIETSLTTSQLTDTSEFSSFDSSTQTDQFTDGSTYPGGYAGGGGYVGTDPISNPGPCTKISLAGPTDNCTVEDLRACVDHMKSLRPGVCDAMIARYLWAISPGTSIWVVGYRTQDDRPIHTTDHPDFAERMVFDLRCGVRMAVSRTHEGPGEVEFFLSQYGGPPPNRQGAQLSSGNVEATDSCTDCHESNNNPMGFGPDPAPSDAMANVPWKQVGAYPPGHQGMNVGGALAADNFFLRLSNYFGDCSE